MATTSGDDPPPPKSTDLAGWQQAISDGLLRKFRLEDIVAAFQDLEPKAGRSVRNSLARHLNDSVIGILRQSVGNNHPNEGWDIIHRVHSAVFEAILKPASADGKAMREAFIPRLKFRLKDALIVEYRAFRHEADSERDPLASPGELDASDLAEAGAPDTLQNLRAPRHYLEEQLDVDRLLEANIHDERKRLAFRLFMDGVPAKSKKTDSIAKALGITDKTARAWIKEVQEILKSKVGDGI